MSFKLGTHTNSIIESYAQRGYAMREVLLALNDACDTLINPKLLRKFILGDLKKNIF